MAEKKQELEKRLQDVTGQLGSAKKAQKKGNFHLISTSLTWYHKKIERNILWIKSHTFSFSIPVEEAAAGKLETVPPPGNNNSSSSSSSDSSSSSSSDSSSSDSSDSDAG